MEKSSKLIDTSQDINEISFQLNNNQFADMILNFLGKKEKLRYKVKSFFVIRLNDIEQFYYLVNEKISKEKNTFIDHFLVNLRYSDGTSREVSGIDSLNEFLETRDVIAKNITMTWNILANYPNSKTIEHQKIELSFTTNEKNKPLGEVILVVNHTNQAWGIEVLNLIKDKILDVSIKRRKIHKFSEKILKEFEMKTLLLPFVLTLLIISAVFSMLELTIRDTYSKDDYHSIINEIKKSNSMDARIALFSLDNIRRIDLDYVADMHIENINIKESLKTISRNSNNNYNILKEKFFVFLLSGLAIFISVFFYLKQVLKYYGNNSYILINRRSENEYKEYILTKNKMEFYSINFLIFAIICGVLGNVIYSYILTSLA